MQPQSPPLNLGIEDAILFGNAEELDEIIELIDGDDNFPTPLRDGLHSLRYFRRFYGKDNELAANHPMKRQKIALMESSWGAELLEHLRRSEQKNTIRTA